MKHDPTTGTWQDDTGCPISIILVSTSDVGRMERPTLLQHRLYHQSILPLAPHHWGHYSGHTQICHPHQSTRPTCWQSWSPMPTYTGCPRLCHYYGYRSQECPPCFRIHKDLPNFPIHQTIGALFDISTNNTSKNLQQFHCILPHIAEIACAPSIPPTDRINHFLTLVLLRVHEVESNYTSMTTSLTHYTTKSSPMLPTSFTSSLACFCHKHHTPLSDYVKAIHTTASNIGNSTQA